MKKAFIIFVLAFTSLLTYGQSPQSFKYQSLLRDKSGLPLSEKNVSVRIAILRESLTGASVYSEIHKVKSSTLGVINLEIGRGTQTVGTFSSIAWGQSPHFVRIEMDPLGGNTYELVGTSQLLSVPYALFAEKSGDEKWESVTGGINFKGGNVGVGTSSPTVKLDIDGGGDLNLLNLRNNNNSLGINSYVSSNTDFHGSALIGRRSRGSFASPLTVLEGDRITGLYGSLFANGGYQNSAAVQMYVGLNPGPSSYPSNIRFETTATNEVLRAERMRIAENGNIGIGITNPQFKLDVAGHINSTGVLINGSPLFSPWVANSNHIFFNSGNVGIGLSNPLFELDVAGQINSTGLLINGSPLFSPWVANSSHIFFNSGNVGIGLSNPLFKLDVAGQINSTGVLINGSPLFSPWVANSNHISFNSGNVGIGLSNPLFKLDVSGQINSTGLLINGQPVSSISPWGIDGSNVFLNSGNVGIGTSSPTVKLDIDGGGNLNLVNLTNNSNSLGVNATVASETDFHASAFIGRRSRGSISSPMPVFSGDRITGLYGSLFVDGAHQNAGGIQFYAGTNLGPGSYPINIRFETTSANQTTRVERMRVSETGNIIIKTGDVLVESIGSGVIMKSPDGNCWRLTVNNSGAPVFATVACPQ